jgi:hypothetical protein
MPFLLNLESRQVSEIKNIADPRQWLSIRMDAKRLANFHPHEIEWEYFPARGLLNREQNLLIVQNRDDAFDIEYYTREGTLLWNYDNPCNMVW